jgi:predicted phage terminase large subunit-like protein
MGRKDIVVPWLFDRCREVQASPDGHIDLWAREHYKSTIITFALTVQNILRDPDLTVGFFSHTRPIAKAFLRQIKREFESNERLKALFPEILWENPSKESPKWSEDDGIIVKRKGNPKESTLEAWGLVDGQPTGRHFGLMVYDDVVTRESVSSPEMIKKVTEAWELSRNLGTEGGTARYCGTRYHYNDTYSEIMRRGAASPRIYPATEDGTVEGEPVLLTRERLAEKRKEQGPYTFACQQLLDPKADETQGFKPEWLKHHEDSGDVDTTTNRYILVDPASEKKRSSDYTAMFVVGLGEDSNYYVQDFYRDRLSLTQRADLLFRLHRVWTPKAVGYEKNGFKADIEHMQDRMNRENYRFSIVELPVSIPKLDRIRRLIPLFEQGRVWLPEVHYKTNYEGLLENLTAVFVEEEYKAFPVGHHDDMLDALSRILDEEMPTVWPQPIDPEIVDRYRRRKHHAAGTWMGV